MKKIPFYETAVILCYTVLPVLFTTTELQLNQGPPLSIAFRWFVFFGIGLRLLAAGLKQLLNPQFTAETIFEISDPRASDLVREIGFGNIAIGSIALLSPLFLSFRLPAACIGNFYILLTAVMHLLKKEKNRRELFITASSFFIVSIITLLALLQH